MSRALCIKSNCAANELDNQIEKEVTNFLNESYKLSDSKMNVFILKPIDNKINTEMLNNYINYLKKTAVEGSKKVAIIYNFELLSVANQNKLLIFIEQENKNLLQIFTTNNINNIIQTIISRTNIITIDDDYYDNIEEHSDLFIKIITSNIEKNTYEEYKDFLDHLYVNVCTKEYKKAYILYTVNATTYDEILFDLIYKMLLYSIRNNNQLAKKVMKLERQLNSNTNKKLQMDNIFVTVMNGGQWN